MSEIEKPDDAPAAKNRPRGGEQQKRDKRDVHGWVVLDKPVGMTSTHAVAVVKRLFSAKRAGHAGTLDPLASGCLPIALGEATKTVPVHHGRPQALSLHRPLGRGARHRRRRRPRGRDERGAARPGRGRARCCPQFTGTIEQVPPRYSAIKIEGERAYDLARDGEVVDPAKPSDRCRLARPRREPRSGPFGVRDRMRQRHLCPGAGPRYGPGFGLSRPCLGPAAHLRSGPSARLQ